MVSALRGEGLEELARRIAAALPSFPIEVRLLVPYEHGDVVARLHREAEVMEMRREAEGTLLLARVGEKLFAAVKDYIIEPAAGRAPAG